MSIFDDIKIPSYGPQEGQAPTQPAAQTGGIYGSFKIPDYSQIAAKTGIFDNVKVPTPSPYFSTTPPSGASNGFSDEKDPYSNRPFFAFRNPGDTSTTTDKTRVATTFDPTVPQKLDRTTFENERMPQSASSQLRKI